MASAPNHSLLDMSPFAGMPPESITRLTSLFYTGNSLASGAAQLDVIETSIKAGEEPTAIGHKLTQLASTCVQAGAVLLGRSASQLATTPVRTPAHIDELRWALECTANALRLKGILPPAAAQPAARTPAPIVKAQHLECTIHRALPAVAASVASCDAADQSRCEGHALPTAVEPLLDMSSYDGLPRSTVAKLVGIFYCSNIAGSGVEQLDAIEADLRAEGSPAELLYKLHQLAGSALQAGALRLGKTARFFREESQSKGLRLVLGHVHLLRDILASTADELRAMGLDPRSGSSSKRRLGCGESERPS